MLSSEISRYIYVHSQYILHDWVGSPGNKKTIRRLPSFNFFKFVRETFSVRRPDFTRSRREIPLILSAIFSIFRHCWFAIVFRVITFDIHQGRYHIKLDEHYSCWQWSYVEIKLSDFPLHSKKVSSHVQTVKKRNLTSPLINLAEKTNETMFTGIRNSTCAPKPSTK